MAEIAIPLIEALARRRRDGMPGRTTPRVIARGDGWSVADVICTSGPRDRRFEEQHHHVAIAIVMAGSFQYRCPSGHGLMTPGSVLLGNAGHCFECGHDHGDGDRCLSFWYRPDYLERVAADAGVRRLPARFTVARLPAMRPLSSLVARAAATLAGHDDVPWEALGLDVAADVVSVAAGASQHSDGLPLNAEARVTRVARAIEAEPTSPSTLGMLARESGLSPYHFLRVFERVTGVTPHQYVRRARLRAAAARLLATPDNVIDIALDSGFGDVSNFNRAFRVEFGMSPRAFRHRASRV